jgi:hypothetical protein
MYWCNLARYWLQAVWGWHGSVETCSRVIIYEIIVCICWFRVQNNNRYTVQRIEIIEAKIFISLVHNIRRGLLPRKTTDFYSIVSSHTLCNHPTHTDVARGAYVLTGAGEGNASEPARTQERSVEFGKSLIRKFRCLSRHGASNQKFYTQQYQTLGLCSYTQGGLGSKALAVNRCEVLADGVVDNVAWFAWELIWWWRYCCMGFGAVEW